MLRGGDVNDIIELKRQGLSICQIRDLTGFDRKTIRKYLDDPRTPRYEPRPKRPSKLDAFKPFVDKRLAEGAWNAVALLEELKKEGYTGQLSILKDYLRPLRQQAGVAAVRRFETPPGLQAQLDWGKIGQIETPEGVAPLHCLVFTLGHSRALFAQVALDMTMPTLLRLHEEAFSQLGGVPREILYDRMKTVVQGTDERGETVFHPLFMDFARYWGFTPRACRPYRPQTKGKIERGVGYIKKSFLSGRRAHSLPDLQAQLREWVWQSANVRVHGTTHRRVLEHWQEEKAYLSPLMGRAAYPFASEHSRKVSRDAFISYRGNRYSVPWRTAGQEVQVRQIEGEIAIHQGGKRLAVHLLSPPGAHQCVLVASHHEGIPLGSTGRGGKPSLYIALPKNPAPQVQVRSLATYDLEICLPESREVSGD